MRRRVLTSVVVLGLCLGAASVSRAMDLRELPQWVRHMIETVEIDWAKQLPAGWGVHIAAPGLAGPEPVALPVEDGGRPGGVHLAPGGVTATPQPVHLAGPQEQVTKQAAEPEAPDPHALAKAGMCVSVIEEQNMSPQQFVAWAQENDIGPGAMAAAYGMVSREPPYWSNVAEVVSAGLLTTAGDGLEHLEDIPVPARPGLAIYLGLQDRAQDVKAVLSSIPASDLDGLKPNAYYHVASELLRHSKCLRTAIWAWKTEAARRGPMDRALVCFELELACKRLGDPDVIRDELVPWAEAALATPGSESQWGRALPALLWAYNYVGQPQKAVERGYYWLQEGKERRVRDEGLAGAQLRLASILTETGQYRQAADVLCRIAECGSERAAETAQIELLRIAQKHRDLGPLEVLRPRLRRASHDRIRATVRFGQLARRLITLTGNPTFKAQEVTCTLPFVTPKIALRRMDQPSRVATYEVQLVLRPPDQVATFEGTLVITVNDPDKRNLRIPVKVEVSTPLVVRPDTLFFGFVKLHQPIHKTLSIEPRGATAFTVNAATSDQVQIQVGAPAQRDTKWVVPVAIDTSRPGVVDGSIRVMTDIEGQDAVLVPVYAHVVQDE